MTGNLRLAVRLAVFLGWTLLAMPIQAVLLKLPGRGKERFAAAYWRGVRRVLGLHITIIGELSPRRPVVYVVNHCSWIDIVALGSVLPGCFVAKSEIAGWPFISLIAKLGRTVFVSRSKTRVERERGDIASRLADGDNIILFPEGTTSDGTRVLKFQTAFMAIAEAAAKPFIQPVTLVYDGINGLPMHRHDRPVISWYGDMDLASHYPVVGRLRSIHATMILDEAIAPGTYANRKELAAALEARLAANAAALRQGRAV